MSGDTALRFLGVGNMLDREYRNSPAFQWARELVRNGIEASATNIDIGVEWRGVEATGVYRLQYSDNGIGMNREELREYMRTLGKGSKVVGGPHDNYALGCRMTLLPWNTEGVVVISQVEGEQPWMVKMMFDPEAGPDRAGEYVLEEVEWDEADGSHRSTVFPPYKDDELGLDWAEAIPKQIVTTGHGTTFVLLGKSPKLDTLDGDVERSETLRDLTRKYFNTRFWNLPEGVTLRCVEFVRPADRSTWPKSENDPGTYQYRTVKGAEEIVEYVKRGGETTLQAKGDVDLPDGTKVHWYLREPGVDTGGVGTSGFIAVQYRGELYSHAYANKLDGDTRIGANVYRQFGIGHDEVRKRTFLFIEPPEYQEDAEQPGVAPSTARADLYWMGTGSGARIVKQTDWAEEFADRLPEEIQIALRSAQTDAEASEDRDDRLRRVFDRFKKRWSLPKAKVSKPGESSDTTTTPLTAGSSPRQRPDVPTTTGRRNSTSRRRVTISSRNAGVTTGNIDAGLSAARTTASSVGYPEHQWVNEDDLADAGMMAAWQGASNQYPNGLVQMDQTHPVITGQIEYWQAQYPAAFKVDIERIVKESYADVAIAKVAHIQALRGPVLTDDQVETMLLNPSLTSAMLGLLAEDAIITPRLGGLGAKRKRTEADVAAAAPATAE